MEVWPAPQMRNTTRVVCKLINTSLTGVYDLYDDTTIETMLHKLKPLIKKKFNINDYELQRDKETIIPSESTIKNIFNNDYVVMVVKPEYMYSLPQTVRYTRLSTERISYLIKLDAIKKIQKFFRRVYSIECPCCYEKFSSVTKFYNCDHIICNKCFNTWNLRSDSCPCCRETVKEDYRITEPTVLEDFWNILRENTNNNNNNNLGVDLFPENIDINFNRNTNRNIEVMNISNRIMNIFPESHSDSVIYTYSSSPTIFDAINSPSSSNLLRN